MSHLLDDLTPDNIANFNNGTNEYTRHWTRRIVMTDGPNFVSNCGCAWLLDIIASHQLNPKVRAQEFQVWKLSKVTDGKHMARVVCEDGNDKLVIAQNVEYTDFPFDRFPDGLTFYVEKGSLDGEKTEWICMFPSER